MKFLNKYRWPGSWYDLCSDGRYKKRKIKGERQTIGTKKNFEEGKENYG